MSCRVEHPDAVSTCTTVRIPAPRTSPRAVARSMPRVSRGRSIMHLDTLRAAWQLLRLLAAVRFRASGRYLRWRRETAFGHDRERWPSDAERRGAILRYGAWVAHMRRLGRK